MCEAHAYLLNDQKEEMLLENVDHVDVEGEEIRLVNIFGEQKIVKAKMKSYSSSDNRMVFEPLA